MVDLGLKFTSSDFHLCVFFFSVWFRELSGGQFPVSLGNGGGTYSSVKAVMMEVPAHTENQSYGDPQSPLSRWDLNPIMRSLTGPFFSSQGFIVELAPPGSHREVQSGTGLPYGPVRKLFIVGTQESERERHF